MVIQVYPKSRTCHLVKYQHLLFNHVFGRPQNVIYSGCVCPLVLRGDRIDKTEIREYTILHTHTLTHCIRSHYS